ncbi:MAG: hypothetical protein PHH28_09580, partial [Desulfuromonadaceae bacterium]|nr:hypothetical protein [Desulfuromonadaceae bacterium]
MPHFLKIRLSLVVCLGMLIYVTCAYAIIDPRFDLDPQTLSGLKSVAKPHRVKAKRSVRTHAKRTSTFATGGFYTVKAGDNLFKILMRDYGLS